MTERNGLSAEEAQIIMDLQELTKEGQEIKIQAAQVADKRRQKLVALKGHGWSMRRIGETIGVSGQRVDSMIKIANGVKPKKQRRADEAVSEGVDA